MCLAVPAQVRDIEDGMARCAIHGGQNSIRASLMLLDEYVTSGDYVLIHAGFALRRLDRSEALKTMDLMQEMAGQDADSLTWGRQD
ncbi:MAG: HypC/HybG/HupF family hydrogenase formation chaperone [Desulfohalobiaceae bacterium]|nr:HypC/HybG/HupF family hydrogenase formation chaperone [Desulfohalobiaceae bacterium]